MRNHGEIGIGREQALTVEPELADLHDAACIEVRDDIERADAGHLVHTISGPSLSGKGTLMGMIRAESERIAELAGEEPPIVKVPTYTTRDIRTNEDGTPKEIDGVHYHFVTQERHAELFESGGIVERNFFNGNYYGSGDPRIEYDAGQRARMIMEMNIDGVVEYQRRFPGVHSSFVVFDTWAEQMRRLELDNDRNNPEMRVREAAMEVYFAYVSGAMDVVITRNNGFDSAAAQVAASGFGIDLVDTGIDTQRHLYEMLLEKDEVIQELGIPVLYEGLLTPEALEELDAYDKETAQHDRSVFSSRMHLAIADWGVMSERHAQLSASNR